MLTASTGFLDTIGTSESAGGSAGQERLQRAHILQLNQVLAKQVTERSKRVAGECVRRERPRWRCLLSLLRRPQILYFIVCMFVY